MSHGAAFDTSSGILLDELFADSFVESLSELAYELFGFVELIFSKEFAEAAAHIVDTLVNELVSTGALDALAQSLFSVLEIWHTKVGKG